MTGSYRRTEGFNRRLADARKKRKMSQFELGNAVRFHRNTIARWETNTEVTLEQAALLAEALDCDFKWLAFGSGRPPKADNRTEAGLRKALRKVMQKFEDAMNSLGKIVGT